MADDRHALPKLGRRHTDKSRPVVRLVLTGAVPAHPAAVDHLALVPEWNGRLNQDYGVCGPVTCANSAIDTWKYLLGEDITVPDASIIDLYRRSGNPNFDPATGADDNGVDMTVMLAALVRGGMQITHADGSTETITPLCFAETPADAESQHAVTSIFGGTAMASLLDVAQQKQTGAGNWDYVVGSRIWGGHATYGGAFTSAAGPHDLDISLVTWQERQGTTPSFVSHQVEEVYVIVWEPTWKSPGFQAGVDQAMLVADFEALTGRAWPGPAPAPAPAPAPVPADPDAAYWSDPRLAVWASRRHSGDNAYAARQYVAGAARHA